MSSDKPVDPSQTYVLEETAITRVNSLEELAEMAMHQESSERASASCKEDAKDRRSSTPQKKGESDLDDLFGNPEWFKG